MSFQIIASIFSIIGFLWGIRLIFKFRNKLGYGLFVSITFLIGFLFLQNPDLTSVVAHYLGIDRGADLLSYIHLLVFVFSVFMFYLKLEKQKRQISILTRELAIKNSQTKS
ncbi:MAG: DUF2304 domain-containing protein [Bdellovibrionota bacterium]|nr:hypothetical protein [Pseudobdellovibrionaceae bacterium]|tara:strand:+ start:40639 stop:40971 length:333 start_codon:yes stop_codon:yes gene_type:complete